MAASSEGRPIDGPHKDLEQAASYSNNIQPYPSASDQQVPEFPLPTIQTQQSSTAVNGTHPKSLIPNIPIDGSNINTSTLRDKSDSREQATARKDSPSLRERSRGRTGTTRTCGKCGGQLSGQFVRALGDTFHLQCFTCNVGLNRLWTIVVQSLMLVLISFLGLRQDCRFEILSHTRSASRSGSSM